MFMFFWVLWIIVILQRLVELQVAKINKKWIMAQGGYEVGQSHYKYMVLLHSLFFLVLLVEVQLLDRSLAVWWYIPFSVFMLAQLLRIWCLFSLGRFWNTRIMILPGAQVIEKGPYRWIRHPNYVIVIAEVLFLPLIFQAFYTALLFTILNALMLSIRIPYEEKALREVTNYRDVFDHRPRLLP